MPGFAWTLLQRVSCKGNLHSSNLCIAASAWYYTVFIEVLPLAARTTSAPRPALACPLLERHLRRLCRRKGIPHVRRGVGYCGCLADGQTSSKKPLGVPASWGSREAATFWSGLLLGCLGVASGLSDRSHLSTALWGIQKGKADVALGLDWRKPDEPPRPRGPTCPPTQ